MRSRAIKTGRVPIPPDVQAHVRKRDRDQCVICGSKYGLHFDHLVPVSKGGASIVPNIRLLCAKHNLAKGSKLVQDGPPLMQERIEELYSKQTKAWARRRFLEKRGYRTGINTYRYVSVAPDQVEDAQVRSASRQWWSVLYKAYAYL